MEKKFLNKKKALVVCGRRCKKMGLSDMTSVEACLCWGQVAARKQMKTLKLLELMRLGVFPCLKLE